MRISYVLQTIAIILCLVFSIKAHAADYISMHDNFVINQKQQHVHMGWTFIFNFKTSSIGLSTPTTIFIRDCNVYIDNNFQKTSKEMIDMEKQHICGFDETEALLFAKKVADEDESARTLRGESSTKIELKRLINKVSGNP